MSIEKTAGSADDLVTTSGYPDPDATGPRLRQKISTGVARLRETAPAGARRAGTTVRQKPVPAAGALAVAGGVVALLIVRRRATRARAAQARKRWLPTRFQR
jgi:hypothetical protein